MERRASKRAASSRASQRIECLLNASMDPKLWGNLPPEVLLRIYQALPIRDFYKLRVVCKEWNNVACERRCFSDSVPKPYFVLVYQGNKPFPMGTLAYNTSSGHWIWKLLDRGYTYPGVGHFYEPFAVEGIFFEGSAVGLRQDSLAARQDFRVGVPQNLLYDVHTDKGFWAFRGALGWRRIPEATQMEDSILGMSVDTSTRPYTYKLIVGHINADTLILDSQTNRWEPKPSRMVRCRAPCKSSSPKSSLQCNGHMYVWSESDEIQVYSVEEDNWSTLNAPPRHASDDEFRGLGHWQSELYAVTKNEQGSLSVWKLMDRVTQEWSEFERIPSSLFPSSQGLCCLLLQPIAMSIFSCMFLPNARKVTGRDGGLFSSISRTRGGRSCLCRGHSGGNED